MTPTARDIHISLPVSPRAEAEWGVGDPMTYYRDVLVEPDGSVLAYDGVADCYTRHHDLTPAQEAEARARAARLNAR
jgi:hypothetical protein